MRGTVLTTLWEPHGASCSLNLSRAATSRDQADKLPGWRACSPSSMSLLGILPVPDSGWVWDQGGSTLSQHQVIFKSSSPACSSSGDGCWPTPGEGPLSRSTKQGGNILVIIHKNQVSGEIRRCFRVSNPSVGHY